MQSLVRGSASPPTKGMAGEGVVKKIDSRKREQSREKASASEKAPAIASRKSGAGKAVSVSDAATVDSKACLFVEDLSWLCQYNLSHLLH